MKQNTLNVIYALVDPRKPEVIRYIGRTNKPSFRHLQHCSVGWGKSAKEHWVEDMRMDGVLPQMLVLESVSAEQAAEREKHWIELQPAGQLTNFLPAYAERQIAKMADAATDRSVPQENTLKASQQLIARDLIETALTQCGWNITKASKQLGVSRPTVYEKIQALGIQRPT